jgi:hypothetical protein
VNHRKEPHDAPEMVKCYVRWKPMLPALSIFTIGIVTYGVFASRLGFYIDDWPVVWVYSSLGSGGIARYFNGNRPFAGLLYSVLFPYLGILPVKWHFLALLLRCMSSVTIYYIIDDLWKNNRDIAWTCAVVALLYPGFAEQPLAVTYIPQNVSFNLCLLSMLSTIYAIRKLGSRWIFFILSLASALLGYMIIEYYVGLELLRPIIILFAVERTLRKRKLSKYVEVLFRWSPYLLVLIMFVIWRLFFFHAWPPTHDGMSNIAKIMKDPVAILTSRMLEFIRNIFMATIFAWTRALNPEMLRYEFGKSVAFSWVIGILVAGISALTMKMLDDRRKESNDCGLTKFKDSANLMILLLGICSLAFAGIPFIYAGLDISFESGKMNDRFCLPYILGSSLLLAGLLMSVRMNYRHKYALVAVVLFLFSSFQFRNGNAYRNEWQDQKLFFWQLAWRIPSMRKGTSVYVANIPFSIQSNHSAGLLDMLYNKEQDGRDFDYFLFDLNKTFKSREDEFFPGDNYIRSVKYGEPVMGGVRSFVFRGTTALCVVVWVSPSGTLRFIDNKHVAEVSGLPSKCENFNHLSDMMAVVGSREDRPSGFLLGVYGPEPRHEWAYFFQKAELGRQYGLWKEVARLGEEARNRRLNPVDASEWLPFIEGYAMAGNYERAIEVSEQLLDKSPMALVVISNMWQRIIRNPSFENSGFNDRFNAIRNRLILM